MYLVNKWVQTVLSRTFHTLVTKLKTSPLPQVARFHFFLWKLDRMTRHIAQEQTLGEKISQYIVIRQKNQFDMWIQELVSRRKKSWTPEMCNTPKPYQLVWCLTQLFKIRDSVQFMVSCDGSIHVLWTYHGQVLVFGCIERQLTKPRLCDYRSIIACYLHMQPWVARFPLPDFQ